MFMRAAAGLRISATPRSAPFFASRHAVSFQALGRTFHSARAILAPSTAPGQSNAAKDGEKPKRPLSAFFRFCAEKRMEMQDAPKGEISPKKMVAPHRERWEDRLLTENCLVHSLPGQGTAQLWEFRSFLRPSEAIRVERAFGNSETPTERANKCVIWQGEAWKSLTPEEQLVYTTQARGPRARLSTCHSFILKTLAMLGSRVRSALPFD